MADQAFRLPVADAVPHPLGRHVRHDEQSRRFGVIRTAVPTRDVRHRNWGTRLDQGDLGSCVPNAATHALNHDPLRARRRPGRTFTEADAIRWYSAVTAADSAPGQYPPDDTGSDGLSMCKVLQAEGRITRYEWAFGFAQGLGTIAAGPLMQGTVWKWDMFQPDSDGRVHVSGDEAGGHEYLWIGVDVARRRSWFLNSWGPGWGGNGTSSYRGQFYLTWDDHAALLANDGDLVRPVT